MKSRVVIAAAVTAATLTAVVVALVVLHSARTGTQPAARSGPGQVPSGAVSAVRLLVSASGRRALTPELNSVLPSVRLFPPGATFTVQEGSWHRAGAYANVSGTLRVPGKPADRAEIGLVRRDGRWLVTFEEAK